MIDDLATRPVGGLTDVPVVALDPNRFEGTADPEQFEHLMADAGSARVVFRGRVVWNVNSTAVGGGVAEMLRPLLGYVRGAGVDARWLVIRGDPAFFQLTKRIHNHLHGNPGDGGDLGDVERATYVRVLAANAAELATRVHPRDVVILHDPQTAGLVDAVRATGARVIWRCHIGADHESELVRGARRFIAPFVASADAYVFSRDAHVWDVVDRARVSVIPPSIDALALKNRDLEPSTALDILAAAGVVTDQPQLPPAFTRSDGTPGRVDRGVTMVGGPIPREAPLVVQVSRWDRLKDPEGVVAGFAMHVAPHHPDARLAVVGPDVAGVSDDPEGGAVLAAVAARREVLDPAVRDRVHLLSLPTDDADVNAVLVNAMQRHARVVVQKSLAEGFGLTVAEAMWKARPVIGSRVGGIQDQIEDGRSGVLVDPDDLAAYGAATLRLLGDAVASEAMGVEARSRVRRRFLGPRHLIQYFELTAAL